MSADILFFLACSLLYAVACSCDEDYYSSSDYVIYYHVGYGNVVNLQNLCYYSLFSTSKSSTVQRADHSTISYLFLWAQQLLTMIK